MDQGQGIDRRVSQNCVRQSVLDNAIDERLLNKYIEVWQGLEDRRIRHAFRDKCKRINHQKVSRVICGKKDF